MRKNRGRLLIPSPFLSTILTTASILLASSIFLYPEVKEALPDLLIFIINKYVLFSIHYGLTFALGTNLDLESWVQSVVNLKGPSVMFPSCLLLDLCSYVLGDPAVCTTHTCDFSSYWWSTLHSSILIWSDVTYAIWLFPFFRQHTQGSLYIIYLKLEMSMNVEGLKKTLQMNFWSLLVFFYKFRSGMSECFIPCPYQECSVRDKTKGSCVNFLPTSTD